MRDTIKVAMLDEYDHGFNDAANAINAGLIEALAKSRTMTQAEPLIPGLETAVYIVDGLVKGLKEALKSNTVTETNGENTNG